MSYLEAAESVADWLMHTAVRADDGWSWPTQPDVSNETDPSLGWGTAGPTLFFIEAFRTAPDPKWLEAARGGAEWIRSRHLAVASEQFGCGLFTGVAGWVFILSELEAVSGDESYGTLAGEVVRTVVDHATSETVGSSWRQISEILWGTAGIGCMLVATGRERIGDEATSSAGPLSTHTACVGRTLSTERIHPSCPRRRRGSKGLLASARRCYGCIATRRATRGSCPGRTHRAGRLMVKADARANPRRAPRAPG